MTILDKLLEHPILLNNPNAKLEFSKYVYKERGVTFKREIYHCTFKEFQNNWIEELFKLEPEEELALNSRVEIDNQIYHLPLIDFKIENYRNQLLEDTLKSLSVYVSSISKTNNKKIHFFLFDSGTSYHGYFDCLIPDNKWKGFLGELLLQNNISDFCEITDSRWVGHSLKSNFCALRLSNNTGHYKKIPEIKKIH